MLLDDIIGNDALTKEEKIDQLVLIIVIMLIYFCCLASAD